MKYVFYIFSSFLVGYFISITNAGNCQTSSKENKAVYNITWTDKVNTTSSGGTLTKTSSTVWWNAGAASVNKIPAGQNGWIEMTVDNPATDIMFGLSYRNDNHHWNTIDFNFYMSQYRGRKLIIYQRSTQKTSNNQLGSYARGDKIRVERIGSYVYFKKNGSTLYSLPVDRNRALIADVAMYTPNSRILNAKCSHARNGGFPVVWTDKVNTTASGNTLIKTSGTVWWNAGAASVNKIPSGQNGWIEMTVDNPSTDIMFGLSYGNDNHHWNTIDFNFYMSQYRGRKLIIYQRSTQKTSNSQLGSYARGDKIRVERIGSYVYFKKNGSTLYSLPVDRNRALIADVAMYTPNSRILNAVCSHSSNRNSEDITSMVNTIETKDHLKIFPNPLKDGLLTLEVNSELNTNLWVEVFNISGKKVYDFNQGVSSGISRIKKDMSSLPSGLYILKVKSEKISFPNQKFKIVR